MRHGTSARGLAMFCSIAFGTAVLVASGPAIAATCAALKSELSQLQAGSSNTSPAARKWTSDRKQQQRAISAVERDIRYLGCANTASAECKSLSRKLDRMTSNLAAIDRQLAKAGRASPGAEKRLRQVRAALRRQNCDAPAEARPADTGNRPRSFLARLFNPQQAPEIIYEQDHRMQATRKRTGSGTKKRGIPSGGKFRTMCVRTCDGYFFPVSYSTNKGQFANDAARCTELCPASPTELYVYRNPGGDKADMISLAGDLYTDQPFAFRHKSEFVEGCGCRFSERMPQTARWREVRAPSGTGSRVYLSDIGKGITGLNLRTGRGDAPEDPDQRSPLSQPPLTRAQLPAHADPDTRFNLEKGFDVSAPLDALAGQMDLSGTQPASGPAAGARDALPLLSSRRDHEEETALNTAAISPVFDIDDPGFRPAPDRESPVRVVGPEFFVAQ